MDISEWIPWGGLVHPEVLRCKDWSYLSVFQYQIPEMPIKKDLPAGWEKLRRGWSLWCEKQHPAHAPEDKYFLAVHWNPFRDAKSGQSKNTLSGKSATKDKELTSFQADVQTLDRTLFSLQALTYQDFINYLAFTVDFGTGQEISMPDEPLYLDALLTQDVHFQFKGNDIFINDKRLIVFSFLTPPADMQKIYALLEANPYRHVKRLLAMNEQEAKKDLQKYTARWFPSRKPLRDMAMEGLLTALNGYALDAILFLTTEEENKKIISSLEKELQAQGCAYAIEDFHRKEIFWASIPGIYLAYARPPVTQLSSFADFLGAQEEEEEKVVTIQKARALSAVEAKLAKKVLTDGQRG